MDAPEAAFYARMAPVGRNFGSVVLYKKRAATLEWGCVGGVYREKRGAVLSVVHIEHTRATWWSLVVPTYMYIHNPTASFFLFPFLFFFRPTEFREERSKVAAGTFLPHSPTDDLPFSFLFLSFLFFSFVFVFLFCTP